MKNLLKTTKNGGTGGMVLVAVALITVFGSTVTSKITTNASMNEEINNVNTKIQVVEKEFQGKIDVVVEKQTT